MTSTLLWTLISLQIAMGAFDTLYHHEFTERLAWRPSQGRELKLHAVRNFFYAFIFITLGWFEVYGGLAWGLIIILAVEVVITLMDFVEEDLSRKLPATERINHTLLALNYGAILVLAMPVLLDWTQRQTGFQQVSYGFRSYFALLSALGVAVFGLRDLLASYRSDRLRAKPAQDLVATLPSRQHILVTGASGFIGKRLCEALALAGHNVTALVRDPKAVADFTMPIRIVTSLDQIHSAELIDAVVNLAGAPIASSRWSEDNKASFVQSRIAVTQAVVGVMQRLHRKPSVFISGSAIGWYGLRDDDMLDEMATYLDCFTHDLCEAWEDEALAAKTLGVRTVLLRIGIVLGTQGGALTSMLTPFEFGLGGRMGHGQQWMSWISRDDLVRLMAHCIANTTLEGPVNATAPIPVRNAVFARELAKALHRPAVFPVPAPVLRLLLGQFANELLLSGQRVIPSKALASGFHFEHADIASAFASMLGGKLKHVARTPALAT
jgi:uncharacterized protein